MNTIQSQDFKEVVSAILRQDLQAFNEKCFVSLHPGTGFVDNWHYGMISSVLQKVTAGMVNRFRLALPPRGGKSGLCSVAFPLHALGHDPSKKILCISYNQDLANQFSRDRRKLLAEPWMKEVFPNLVSSIVPPETESVIATDQGGYIIATSMTGTVTGKGADIIIIDDPLKASDAYQPTLREAVNETFRSTIVSRLNNKNTGAIVLVAQRLHEDDLYGNLDGIAGWHSVSLPAIAREDTDISAYSVEKAVWRKGEALHPGRESLETLETLRAQMGEGVFTTQYLQRPTDAGHRIVNANNLHYYDKLPTDNHIINVALSVDVAMSVSPTADYSVIIATAHTNTHTYVLDVMRGRFDSNALIAAIEVMSRRHPQSVIFMDGAFQGVGLATLLQQKYNWYVVPCFSQHSKTDRLLSVLPLIEAGVVLFPRKAAWLDTFIDELLGFPDKRHDDQVDALSQVLAHHKACTGWRVGACAYDPRRVMEDGAAYSWKPIVRRA